MSIKKKKKQLQRELNLQLKPRVELSLRLQLYWSQAKRFMFLVFDETCVFLLSLRCAKNWIALEKFKT